MRRVARQRARLAMAGMLFVASSLGAPSAGAAREGAHPLHTSITELTVQANARVAEVSVRLFADDLQRAVGARTAPGDAALAAYVGRHFVLLDARGRPVPWRWCGQRRADDLVWLCLRAPAPDALAGAALRVDLACAVYADQVNIVRLVTPRGRRTLLFTCQDTAQRLP